MFNSSCTKLDMELAALQAGPPARPLLPVKEGLEPLHPCLELSECPGEVPAFPTCTRVVLVRVEAGVWCPVLSFPQLWWGESPSSASGLDGVWQNIGSPPLQLLLALSYRGVWSFHRLRRGQVEPQEKNTLLIWRSTQVPGLEGMTAG